ncbi:enoyl-CoA hydratase [Metabacillus litoralis]|uniref:enoyl-CoA hydratase n=2 Tax=Metabacillus TaxID=2675233 RepID=UPI001B8DF130|nr:enoyl-CoA hydratase [Metabacillus litoralis]MCM3161998.1 enoyl-CoA hydratase [Metabacillus litoralis]UHA60392.1 enoyl-CoA hydratase [Metabacillus litoralis]
MTYQTIELVKEGNFATLYLNRVNSLNAMDVEMLQELAECLADVAASNVKLLFVTGRGRAFSAGGDLKTMLSNADESGFQTVMNNIKNIIVSLYTMPAVTVSFLNGAAAGLGLSFALACDQVFAEKNAKIAMNFINIGLIPDGGGHFFLKKRLGEHKAKQVIWEGKSMTSDEALKAGIVDMAYEGDTEEQLELVKRELEARPLKAMIASKLIYSEQEKQLLLETLDSETEKQLEMRRTQDHREGVAAFLEKRPAHFIGN